MRLSTFALILVVATLVVSWPFSLLIVLHPVALIGILALVYVVVKPHFAPEQI